MSNQRTAARTSIARSPRPAAGKKPTTKRARKTPARPAPAKVTRARATALPKPSKASIKPAAASPKARLRARVPTPPPLSAAATRAERRRRFPEALRLRTFSAALTVDNLERSIAFYVDGLGFTIKDRWERDGKLNGVMLLAGNCQLGLTQDDWAKGRARVKGVGIRFFAETGQSLELIATLAREHGIHVEGPKKAPWGAMVVEFVDPDGFNFTIHWPM